MDILHRIIEFKRTQVDERKRTIPVARLESSAFFDRRPLSLREFVRRADRTGIIAEFKRRSPSKGVINSEASVIETTQGYVKAGASGLSVLTDEQFFGGSSEDLIAARMNNECPILRKDFTIDEYQILEAKSIGADAILLIAAVLDPTTSGELVRFAHSLSMEVLLEVHDEEELLAHARSGADLIGVNNRNLKTFDVNLDVSKRLSSLIPDDVVKVSESGISQPGTIVELRRFGFDGFLIGENFMREKDPGATAAAFTRELKALSTTNK